MRDRLNALTRSPSELVLGGRVKTPGNVLSDGSSPLAREEPTDPQLCLKHKAKKPRAHWERRPSGDNVLRRGRCQHDARNTAVLAGVQVEGRPALISNPRAGAGGGRVESSEFVRKGAGGRCSESTLRHPGEVYASSHQLTGRQCDPLSHMTAR